MRKRNGFLLFVTCACMSFTICDLTNWFVGIQHEEQALQKARKIVSNQTLSEPMVTMRDINPAYVCWLDVPDLDMHLPVVQGQDDAFYLEHAWDNTISDLGTPFFDCISHREDSVQIIYGHTVTYDKKAMFTPLHKLAEKREQLLEFQLHYDACNNLYEMVYAFTLAKNNSEFALRKQNFLNQADFDQWIGYAKAHTFLIPPLECTIHDSYVLLQTCSQTMGEFLIVIGRKCIT